MEVQLGKREQAEGFARGSAALVFIILALTGLTPLGVWAQN